MRKLRIRLVTGEGVMQLSMTFANDLQGDMFLDGPKDVAVKHSVDCWCRTGHWICNNCPHRHDEAACMTNLCPTCPKCGRQVGPTVI